MSAWVRHAVYWVPEGRLAEWGAAWLGWDIGTGRVVDQPQVVGFSRPLATITEEPRRYGLHATLKAPFRLVEGATEEGVAAAVAALAATLAPVRATGLRLARLGRFLALVPQDGEAGIGRLAGEVVAGVDSLRAPAPEAELARRRAVGLSAGEEENLRQWGYPYVMEAFRFHVTLTGPLGGEEAEEVEAHLAGELEGLPLRPLALDALAHVAEGADGRFWLIGRHPLQGTISG